MSPAMNMTRILYNGECPICRAEISHYAKRAATHGAPLQFEPLQQSDLQAWGLTRDDAMRRLHALRPDGTRLSGIQAFAAIWEGLPGMGWLATLVRLPVIAPLARLAYDRIAAPLLYRMHLRRERLGKAKNSA